MSHENDSEDDADDSHDDDHCDGDRLSVRFPIGGGFTVSGPNASKLWGKLGWALIIVAAGLVLERIATVFLKLFDNGA